MSYISGTLHKYKLKMFELLFCIIIVEFGVQGEIFVFEAIVGQNEAVYLHGNV